MLPDASIDPKACILESPCSYSGSLLKAITSRTGEEFHDKFSAFCLPSTRFPADENGLALPVYTHPLIGSAARRKHVRFLQDIPVTRMGGALTADASMASRRGGPCGSRGLGAFGVVNQDVTL